VARYGPEKTRFYLNEVIDYAERLTRAALEKLPDGEWSFEDWIRRRRRRLRAADPAVRDHLQDRRPYGGRLDRHQSAGQGAINNTLSFTKAASYTGVRSVLPPGIPNNEGVFRAIEVICPPGTVATACCRQPAPRAASQGSAWSTACSAPSP